MSLIELLHVMDPMGFCAHGAPWTLYVNRVARNSRHIACISPAHLHIPALHQTALIKHKFKGKVVKNFKTEHQTKCRAFWEQNPLSVQHWSHAHEAALSAVYVWTKHLKFLAGCRETAHCHLIILSFLLGNKMPILFGAVRCSATNYIFQYLTQLLINKFWLIRCMQKPCMGFGG